MTSKIQEREDSARSASFGRPLSIIESVASCGSAEGDSISVTLEEEGREDPLRLQITELFKINSSLTANEGGRKDGQSESSNRNCISTSVTLKDLPKLLEEFEKKNGQKLLNEEARPVLDDYVHNSPDIELQSDSLQQMIIMLNASRRDHEEIGRRHSQKEDKPNAADEHFSASDASETDTDHSSRASSAELRHEQQDHALRSEKQVAGSSILARYNLGFPRSQSDRGNLSTEARHSPQTASTAALNRQKRTTSDPSVPLMHPLQEVSTPVKRRGERRKSGETVDRDVLKGKGKAKVPPSSWSNPRPRPPALAKRDRARRVSDLSSAPSDGFDQLDMGSSSPLSASSSHQTGLGLGTPSSPLYRRPDRQRLSSHPDSCQEERPAPLPRSASSASSGFQFPRSSASFVDQQHDDSWDGAAGEQASSGKYRRASSSSRGASPLLDETSYHNFSALSPRLDQEYFGSPASTRMELGGRVSSRHSSMSGRMHSNIDEGDETMTAHDDINVLQARLESLQRLLQEKERQHDSVQQEHELFISRLQDELEDVKTQLGAKRREEKESKARENGHLDSIASLEADLTKTENALQTTRDQFAKTKADYEEQVDETDRLRGKVADLQEELHKMKHEERVHSESARMWETDRDIYREKINDLHRQLNELEAEIAKLEESERENRVLKEQIERLGNELEEFRRGSNILGQRTISNDGTVSKRLGAEIAKSISSIEMARPNVGKKSDEDAREEDGDTSGDTYLIMRQPRAHKSRKSAGQQGSDHVAVPPPTYDEAALEKQVSERLHPCLGDGVDADDQLTAKVKDDAYRSVVDRAKIRCTVLEERMSRCLDVRYERALSPPKSVPVLMMQTWTSWVITFLAFLNSLALLPLPPRVRTAFKDATRKDKQREAIIFLAFGVTAFLAGITFSSAFSTANPGPFRDRSIEDDWYASNSLGLPWPLDASGMREGDLGFRVPT